MVLGREGQRLLGDTGKMGPAGEASMAEEEHGVLVVLVQARRSTSCL